MMLFSLLVAARHQGVSLQPWWGGHPAPAPRPPGQPGLSLLPAGLVLHWQGEHHKCCGGEDFDKSLFLNRWPQPPRLSSSWNGCMGTEGRMPGQTFTFFQLVRMNLFNSPFHFINWILGEMTYFVAAVVVLYNVEDQSQRHYLGMRHNQLEVLLFCWPCIVWRPHPGHPMHECPPQQAADSHWPGGGGGQGPRQVRHKRNIFVFGILISWSFKI